MPSILASCLPKINRSHLQDSDSSDHQEAPPFPVFSSNFNSLYSSENPSTGTAPPSQSSYPLLSLPEFQYGSSTPDLSTLYISQRFFISSPGRSNSIIASSASSPSLKNSMAVPTYSPDPCTDFRRSMEEMVEARGHGEISSKGPSSNWEYLHELLLCYLSLNPKATHKFIIGAFADLVVDHISSSCTVARLVDIKG